MVRLIGRGVCLIGTGVGLLGTGVCLIGGGVGPGGAIRPPPLAGGGGLLAGGVGLLDAGEGGLLHHHAVRLRVGARGPARPGTGPARVAGLAGPARTAAARTACHASAHGTMTGQKKKKKNRGGNTPNSVPCVYT